MLSFVFCMVVFSVHHVTPESVQLLKYRRITPWVEEGCSLFFEQLSDTTFRAEFNPPSTRSRQFLPWFGDTIAITETMLHCFGAEVRVHDSSVLMVAGDTLVVRNAAITKLDFIYYDCFQETEEPKSKSYNVQFLRQQNAFSIIMLD